MTLQALAAQLAGYCRVRLGLASGLLPSMKVLVIKGTVILSFEQALGAIHPPALAESSIFANGVRYILALEAPATSTGSGCAGNCQPVTWS